MPRKAKLDVFLNKQCKRHFYFHVQKNIAKEINLSDLKKDIEQRQLDKKWDLYADPETHALDEKRMGKLFHDLINEMNLADVNLTPEQTEPFVEQLVTIFVQQINTKLILFYLMCVWGRGGQK